MPTKPMPHKLTAVQAEILAVAVATSIASALKPVLESLATDKTDRHQVANAAETAGLKAHEAAELAKVNESRLNGLEKRMDSLMGDGTGRNGAIAEMDRNIGDVKGDVRDMRGEIKTMAGQMTQVLESSKKSEGFMSGFGGARVALGILVTLLTAIGLLITLLVKMK